MLNITLPDHIANRLERLSLATGRPVKFYIREAILQHLDDMEDRFYALECSGRARWPNIETDAETDWLP